MAYNDLDVDVVYLGDGNATTFPINFARTDDEYVVAELYDVTDPANPVQLAFANPADWEVVGNDVVTQVAPTSDQKILIYRSGAPINETNFSTYEFPFDVANITLDKVYQLAQENKRELEFSIKNPRFNVVSGNGSTVSYTDVEDAVEQAAQVTQNTLDIAANTAQLAINTPQIGSNTTGIGTNATNIGTNAAEIASNDLELADHENRITQNEADILAIQGALGGITPPSIVSITAAQTYNASNQDIVIIDTNDAVEVALPAAASGLIVRVKVSEKIASKTVTSPAGIDGFGTTYNVSSEYESISLVSDGTKWYII
jgi:hypothetical protein